MSSPSAPSRGSRMSPGRTAVAIRLFMMDRISGRLKSKVAINLMLIKQNQLADDASFAEWLLQGLSYGIVRCVFIQIGMLSVVLE